jgi:hypothetical protein
MDTENAKSMMSEKLCPKCNKVVIPKANIFGLERCPECKASLDQVAWVSAQPEKSTPAAESPLPDKKSSGRILGFAPIVSREGALKTIKDSAIALLVLAAIQSVIFAFIARRGLIDTFLMAVLALLLLWLKSRIVAILLLIYSLLEGLATLLSFAGVENMGGKNIWLAAVIVWASINAVEATFKLHGKFAKEEPVVNGSPVSTAKEPDGFSQTKLGR